MSLSLSLSICLSVSLSSLPVSLSLSLSLSLSVCLSFSLSVCLSVCLSLSLTLFVIFVPKWNIGLPLVISDSSCSLPFFLHSIHLMFFAFSSVMHVLLNSVCGALSSVSPSNSTPVQLWRCFHLLSKFLAFSKSWGWGWSKVVTV